MGLIRKFAVVYLLISISVATAGDLSAESCGKCHEKEYAQWKVSQHRGAFTNHLFQRGFKRDPIKRCLFCHLPQEAQRNDFYNGLNTEILKEGVTCLSCHEGGHSGLSPERHTPESCARCHQFRFLGRTEFAQQTFNEWKKYDQAPTKRCQDCHMPNGDHRMPGAHDPEMLKKALTFALHKQPGEFYIEIGNAGAGHDVPTGDVFREIKVETRTKQTDFQVQVSIGRNPYFSQTKGKQELKWKHDNALKPSEVRRINLPASGIVAVRVVYYFEGELPGFDNLKGDQLSHTILFEKNIDN